MPCRLVLPSLNAIYYAACGDYHTIAMTKKGDCFVWGENQHGELGLNVRVTYTTPTRLRLPNNEAFRSFITNETGDESSLNIPQSVYNTNKQLDHIDQMFSDMTLQLEMVKLNNERGKKLELLLEKELESMKILRQLIENDSNTISIQKNPSQVEKNNSIIELLYDE